MNRTSDGSRDTMRWTQPMPSSQISSTSAGEAATVALPTRHENHQLRLPTQGTRNDGLQTCESARNEQVGQGLNSP